MQRASINMTWLASWLPSRGNVLFTTLVALALVYGVPRNALPAGVLPQSGTSISAIGYQGRLTDTSGVPINSTDVPMTFRLYNVATGGAPLWQEAWPSVPVTNGLFNVMLGGKTSIPQTVFSTNNDLWLGITIGSDAEMTPRVQLGSVPYAIQALTVTDKSITTAKITDAAVGTGQIADSAVSTAKLMAGAVTQTQAVLGATDLTTSSSTPQDMPGLNLTMTTVGGKVLVMFSGSHVASDAGTVGYWQIVRDGSLVIARNNDTFETPEWITTSIFTMDSPPPGSHTYKVQWWRAGSGTLQASAGAYSENLIAVELKR
jgi:hypothetical protein